MNLPRLPWIDPDVDRPSLWSDLRSGRAGAMIRLGLSLAAAALVTAPVMFILGLFELAGGRVQGEHAALGFAVAASAWCGILAVLWASYRRWRRAIYTALGVFGIWAVTIPLCAFIAETTRQGEFLLAGCIFLAAALTIGLIATSAYRGRGGRAIRDQADRIAIECPNCKYSLVGLESCVCPECGSSWTIDALIGAQDYAVFRRETRPDPRVNLLPSMRMDAESSEEDAGGATELPPRVLPDPN